MQILLLAILAALLVGAFWPRIAAWKASSAAERAFTIRFALFSWLLGFLFVAAFIFLPNKGRVLMAVPVFLVAVSLAKWWKNTRLRMRREAELDTNFQRARRVN